MSKIIDKKGKIFGIINIVDLMVLIVILGLIVAVCYRVFSKAENAEGTNVMQGKQEIYVTFYIQNAVPESLDILKVGDKLVANNAFTTAEIVSIDYKPADFITTDSDGVPHLEEHPLWLDLIIVVKDEVNASNPILKVGGQEARMNYSFILKTQQFEASAKVRGIEFAESNN